MIDAYSRYIVAVFVGTSVTTAVRVVKQMVNAWRVLATAEEQNLIIDNMLGDELLMVGTHYVRMGGDFLNVVLSMLLLEGTGRSMALQVDLLKRYVASPTFAEAAANVGDAVLCQY
jgi:hypothetical protein